MYQCGGIKSLRGVSANSAKGEAHRNALSNPQNISQICVMTLRKSMSHEFFTHFLETGRNGSSDIVLEVFRLNSEASNHLDAHGCGAVGRNISARRSTETDADI